jgi:hypothetical protein
MPKGELLTFIKWNSHDDVFFNAEGTTSSSKFFKTIEDNNSPYFIS